MNILAIGASGDAVTQLQLLLNQQGANIIADGRYGVATAAAVKAFQLRNGLDADGIAGQQTWNKLNGISGANSLPLLTEEDMLEAATRAGIEVAALKAVRRVETGGRSGFLQNGSPVILFEGHIFWKQLENRGIDPQQHVSGNENILYPKWTTQYYQRGVAEYDRLNKAKLIDETAALASASWGLFQIMGFNFKACNYATVEAYVDDQYKGEKQQLESFLNFLRGSLALKALQNKNWAEFARYYNGPGYAANQYDTKMKTAYDLYSKG